MIFHSLTFASEALKTEGETLGFQLIPRDLALDNTKDRGQISVCP